MDTPGGPAGKRGHWYEYLSKFDLHVTYIAGCYNTMADALSRLAYPASEGNSEVSFQVIDFDKGEQALIKKHCLLCLTKNRKNKLRWRDATRLSRQIKLEGSALTPKCCCSS